MELGHFSCCPLLSPSHRQPLNPSPSSHLPPRNTPLKWGRYSILLHYYIHIIERYSWLWIQSAINNERCQSLTMRLLWGSYTVCGTEKYIAARTSQVGKPWHRPYRSFSHCIDQAGLGTFTAKSGRKHYNPPPLTIMWMNFDSPNFPSFCSLSAII